MSDLPVLVVEDDSDLREAIVDTLMARGLEVLEAADGEVAIEAMGRQPVGMVVTDVQMSPMDGRALLAHIRSHHPELPVVMMTAYGTVERAVEAMRGGATDYLMKPFEAENLVDMVDKHRLKPSAMGGPVAEDPASLRMLELAARVADSEATVLLCGESGTGKEVYARFIHEHSPRAKGPFVAINCAAIPENMLEAVLFGYEKGAFTGAQAAHPGKFEQAQGGTLLLDEISEMDLALQAKLLRVLQEREVERLGGRKTISLDVRVVATTNRDLLASVRAGEFREDLYYRLNVFPVRLPPLRERPGDIVPLAKHLMEHHCRGKRPLPRLSEDSTRALQAHTWPGNIRELDNVVQRALILAPGDEIQAQALHFEAATDGLSSTPGGNGGGVDAAQLPSAGGDIPDGHALDDALKDREYRLIVEALRSEGGSRKHAAARLGISPRTLRYKMARLRDAGVELPRDLGAKLA
ncbi:two-component system response regulator FlrC [Natronospira proteinivora]|uniref:Two-component system response regulator FlrC n=1 Tax=Natronospira proteinivora TaxID=1807133 RepID=A0ABT1G553_9GAMM|nr:sigma-54 dependent transcriptional regulator [Natronospira proteinivora]MCP1726434.1 two-component system response regulator FlrC [Natronospira proteinivora]